MKKYTKRLKEHIHGWRVAKNWAAILLIICNAIHMLITHGSIEVVTKTFGPAVAVIAIGETLHHLGMSWVETAESIQERNETI